MPPQEFQGGCQKMNRPSLAIWTEIVKERVGPEAGDGGQTQQRSGSMLASPAEPLEELDGCLSRADSLVLRLVAHRCMNLFNRGLCQLITPTPKGIVPALLRRAGQRFDVPGQIPQPLLPEGANQVVGHPARQPIQVGFPEPRQTAESGVRVKPAGDLGPERRSRAHS